MVLVATAELFESLEGVIAARCYLHFFDTELGSLEGSLTQISRRAARLSCTSRVISILYFMFAVRVSMCNASHVGDKGFYVPLES